MLFAALHYLHHLPVCLPTHICIHKINSVFRNLVLINIFKFIRADDNLLEKSFGTLRKNHFFNKKVNENLKLYKKGKKKVSEITKDLKISPRKFYAILEKKKILIRIGSLRHGGAEKVLVTFLKNLPKDKYEIDLLLNLYSGKYLAEVPDFPSQ